MGGAMQSQASIRAASEWREIAREPFALIEFGGQSILHRNPIRTVEARTAPGVAPALDELRDQDAVGFIGYEAGHALERSLAAEDPEADQPPLLWFMLGSSAEVPPPLPYTASAWAGVPRPLIGRDAYLASVDRIRRHIFDGDVYQVNLTFPAEVKVQGHPIAIYAQLRERAAANWSALVFTGEHWILSFSPELFFTGEDGRVVTRPMKGTAPAGSDPEALRNDPKQRAENLMIVDLLRNDLSRVAKPGSVQVPELFAVEHYPTLLQMTSTITAELEDGLGAIDLLRTIFPCGSVTGAPKIRAMEIIAQQESASRGVYTGSIGTLARTGDAAFNVAIRTLVIPAGSEVARMGLGSGIVADSIAQEEWDECLRKGAFVASPAAFRLIETMRIAGPRDLPDLDLHLDRLEASASALDFKFGRAAIREQIIASASCPGRLRILVAPNGFVEVERSSLPDVPERVEVALAPHPLDRDDFRRGHKTSDRAFYDQARTASGAFELIFVDLDGFLTEGSFTSLFVERDGRLATPPLSRGLLPGILRRKLVESGEAFEADLRPEDLAQGFYIGNALRGLIRARLRQPA
jgi:para-aminobenzoate synthetase / 4-amino-4-deoxychorismate lyase